MPDRPPCSDQSLVRGDPMYGTASAGSSWVLLELPGAWGPSAFMQSPAIIDPDLGRSVVRRIEREKMRIAAIRRPGRRAPTPRFRWFIASSTPGQEWLREGEVERVEDYLSLALDGSDGTPSADPVFAVCAHGKHDQCCAVRGRKVAATLAAAYPEQTWECSHLGGDRFAATMIVLPHGLCYGRVDSAADPVAVADLYRRGRLDNALLRGRTSLPHAVQAAQYFARERSGEDRIDALAPLDVQRRDHRIHVRLDGPSGPLEVILSERLSEPLLSMCSADVAGPVRQFILDSIGSVEADGAHTTTESPY